MKTLFTFLLLICGSGYVVAQNGIEWQPELEVADGSTYGNVRPRIVLTANDVPLVVFGKGTTKQLYAARWNGSAFGSPVALLPENVTAYLLSWTGPDVAAKGDTVVVVFKAEPMDAGHVYAVRSTNGGLTFSDTIRVDDHNNGGVAWMPALGMDANGNPSVVYMAHDSIWENPQYMVTHSTDGGLTYNGEMEITTGIPEEACDCCPAEYLINGNREVMLYRNNDNNVRDIFGVYSTDGGATYPHSAQLNQLDWSVSSCPSSGPHGLLRSNDLITVSMSKASGKNRVYVSTSEATTTFGSPVEFMLPAPSNVNGNQNFPRISGTQDTIVMTWQESDPSNNEIFCSFTTDGDVTAFSDTKAMANNTTSGSQTNPDVVYSNGQIHLVFQDGSSGAVIYKHGTIGTLGIAENNTVSFSVFPNPSNGAFHIEGERIDDVQVLDCTGRSISANIQNNGTSADVQVSGASGMYLIRIIHNGQVTTQSVLVK